MRAIGPLIAALVAVVLVLSGALFNVDQRQNAVVFQLGEVKEVISSPGLHFKWPMIQNVRYFDMRILSYDDVEPLRFITSEKKPVLVDSFVKWRIKDVSRSTSACRATSSARRRASGRPSSDSLQRRVRQAYRARRRFGAARRDHGGGARQGRPGPAPHRRRDHRRAAEARRPAAGSQRVGVPPDGGRAQARGERAAFHGRGRGRAHPRRRGPAARGDPGGSLSRRAARQGRRRRQGDRHLRRRRSRRIPSSTPSTAAWRPTARASAARAT